MMERVDQERPGWDRDQFEVLTGEEVVGVGGVAAGEVVEDGMEGVGVGGDEAGDGGEDDDQAEKEDQGDNAGTSNDAGASENNDGAGPGEGEGEGEAWGGEEGGESEVIWEGNVSVSCCVLFSPPSRPAQRPQTVTRSPCGVCLQPPPHLPEIVPGPSPLATHRPLLTCY